MFFTDLFVGSVERALAGLLRVQGAEKLLGRYDPRLPPGKVHRLSAIAAAEALSRRAGVSNDRIYAVFDPFYGRAMAQYARRNRSDILAYSSYAWEAFRASYTHAPRKLLFQFHPHFKLENRILADDLRASADMGVSFSGKMESGAAKPVGARIKGDSAWQLADHVVCASSFSKRSLVEGGADPAKITVIPYGIDTPVLGHESLESRRARFHVLFVGSGLQRKGLHHLLLAWRRARLPTGARLTVASRVVDPALVSLLDETAGVDFRHGVTADELGELYGSATLFAMPSLVEGFGQVYLESLSHGLPVLGTANTCLPDIGGEEDGIFLVPPGDVDLLAARLSQLALLLPSIPDFNRRAKVCAARFSWERFRASMKDVVHAVSARTTVADTTVTHAR